MKLEDLTDDNGLIVRSLPIEVRAENAERMEFTGIGVPYGEIYDTGWGYRETFDPGSVDGSNAKIYDRHREVIGVAIAGKETAAGYEVTGKISKTTRGLDAWELLKDGAYDSLSIGFKPIAYREDDDGVIHITEAIAREFSLVHNPAYTEAKITNHRHAAPTPKEGTMPPEAATLTRADITPLEDGMAELERAVAKLGDAAPADTPSIPQYRNIGEFVRAIADGDEEAREFHALMTNREAPANVLADAIVKDSWIGDFTRLVENRRRIMNQFGRGTLPATGMNVEYGQLKSDTTTVAKQATEGDNLAGPGKVALEVKTAPVITGGGWSSLSFQAVQRATIPTLNTLWRAMAIKYAAWSNAAVQTAYFDLIAAKTALDPVANPDAALEISGAATVDEYLDMVMEAALIFEERGFALEGLNASLDQFKLLSRLKDGDGRRLMNVYGTGVNQVGELNLKRVDGSLANVPVSLIGTRATTGKLAFYDSIAFETLESPGAPAQLQDENIINLTKQLSLYGYLSVTNPFPDAVLPVKIGA